MKAPAIRLSESAKKAIQEAAVDAGGDSLRIRISDRFEHELFFGPHADGDLEVGSDGITILVDPASAGRADGVSIDFVQGPSGSGFKIENPNEPPKVKPISVTELKAMMDRGLAFELVDVRTEEERAIARISGSRLLDEETRDYLTRLDRNTTIVFQCHHGIRSQSAAEYFRCEHGFRDLFNLQGGIEAWSQLVDPSVPRY
jgi:monothiol glutaredoxin